MKYFCVIFFAVFSLFLHAQKICFQYDLAGNQIVRELCINEQQNKSTESFSDTEVEESLQKFFSEDIISYYPNPVKEELFLKWNLIDDNKVEKIEIYNLNGQLVAIFNQLERENTKTISFVRYPVGVYNIVVYYTNKKQESIRIIKK